MADEFDDRLERRLAPHTHIGFDTSIFVYHFEANPRYLPLTTLILERVRQGRHTAVISTVLLMELNVRPFQLGLPQVALQYEVLLVHFPNLEIVNIDRSIARRAARLRAEHGFAAFDALQLAASSASGATAFITNDYGLRRASSLLDIIVLNDVFDTIR